MDLSGQIESIRYALDLAGDNAVLVSDADIERYLGLYPSDWRLAAAALADVLSARALNRPQSFALTGKMSIDWGDRSKRWREIGAALRAQVAADDQRQASTGIVSVTQLERVGVTIEAPEYSRSRGYRTLS